MNGLGYAGSIAYEELSFGKLSSAEELVELAERSAGSLSEYLRLLRNHAEFREGEFRGIEGHFHDIVTIDRGGKDYHKFYVNTAKERLEQSTI